MPYVGLKFPIVGRNYPPSMRLGFRVTFMYLLLFKRLFCRLKVSSLIIFIIFISLRLILVLCFFLHLPRWNWAASYMLKSGCVLYTRRSYAPVRLIHSQVLYTRASYMPSNTVIFLNKFQVDFFDLFSLDMCSDHYHFKFLYAATFVYQRHWFRY